VRDDVNEDIGELDLSGPQPVLRYVRTLAHSPERVWRALTEPAELEHWFPTTIEGERARGAPLTFAFRAVDIADMEGTMLACDPPRLLEFSWGGDVLRFEIERDGHGCRLFLSDTFSPVGKAARDGAGWHVCLERLIAAVDGHPVDADEDADRWRQVHPGYVERFGPEASTLGPPEEWEAQHGPA